MVLDGIKEQRGRNRSGETKDGKGEGGMEGKRKGQRQKTEMMCQAAPLDRVRKISYVGEILGQVLSKDRTPRPLVRGTLMR